MKHHFGQSLLPEQYRYLNVFISFATEDKEAAEYYYKLFSEYFSVFEYIKGMPPGSSRQQGIDPRVESAIQKCDYFVLLVSDHSMSIAKPWCARELGLARKLQDERYRIGGMAERSPRPFIIPIYCEQMLWRTSGGSRPTLFPIRDYATGEIQEPLVLEGHDPHARPTARSDQELIQLMLPRLNKVRRDVHSQRELEESGVFDLYTALFDDNECDPPEEIARWALEVQTGRESSSYLPKKRSTNSTKISTKIDSLFYFITLYNAPIAFCYLDYDLHSDLVAGNYFAVASGWRGHGLASKFRQVVEADVVDQYPDARGVLILVEPIDYEELEYFAKAAVGRPESVDADHALFGQIRRFKRLVFYQENLGASLFVDTATYQPLIYTDPCLDIFKPRDKWKDFEVDYWIMWVPIRGAKKPIWSEAVRFMCLEIQSKSMVLLQPNERGAVFWKYANDLTNSIIKRGTGKRVGLEMVDIKETWKALNKAVVNFHEIAI